MASPPTSPPAFAETGLLKILLFPDKLKALQKAVATPDPSYPVSVELSLAHLCNLNCAYCSDARIREAPASLSAALLENLFRDLAAGGTRGLTIEGGGEPTLSPLFPAAAEKARARGLALGLITNGVRLFTPATPLSFYEAFQWIRVSLDAASPEEFQELKGRDAYHEVLSNIRALCSIPGPRRPAVGVGYVLTSRNDDPARVLSLARDLEDMGAAYLQIRPVVDCPKLSSAAENDPFWGAELRALPFVNLAPLRENLVEGNASLPCLAHSLTSVIGADGLVWLCGRLNVRPVLRPIGDLTKESFAAIWDGETRRRQTQTLLSGSFCAENCPRCRLSKYNALIASLSQAKSPDFI
ncbi:MAG: radical SAM protein [Deltaproteobacteria bacterium]|jgi:MoaA/NifB/PqqE/SkfB family radical SAM enzyme|nr:radical SAM protein [Deltaproteobacteria bacterium]